MSRTLDRTKSLDGSSDEVQIDTVNGELEITPVEQQELVNEDKADDFKMQFTPRPDGTLLVVIESAGLKLESDLLRGEAVKFANLLIDSGHTIKRVVGSDV